MLQSLAEMERMKEPFNQSDQIQKMGLTPDEISKPHKVRFFGRKNDQKFFTPRIKILEFRKSPHFLEKCCFAKSRKS